MASQTSPRANVSPRSDYRQINPHAFSSDSTWMNLGLWRNLPDNNGSNKSLFTSANENLAREVGALALKNGCSTIVDVGCGRGDSLALWLSPPFSFKRVLGVNSCRAEYVDASRKLEGDKRVSLHYSDAIEFLDRDLGLKDFVVVSVDALYHFKPNRREFFRTARKSGASRLAVSDIVLSEKWAREADKMDFLTITLRNLIIRFIAVAGGIPDENLSYGPHGVLSLLMETGWERTHMETVTDSVFYPFADYCATKSKELSWFSKEKWTLMSSGWFMRFVRWLNAVDFILYAADSAAEDAE